MPLYSDPGYYYGGSSSYSPYYSSNPYASYAGYSRALAGTYVVPTSRTSSHITSSSSRYKPKLTSISELPLASRGLTSLTRIQSPKISYHSLAPKYIPPRPIPINAADIDVSASRYPKHEHYIAPVAVQNSSSKDISSDLNNNSNNNNSSDSSDFMPRVDGADPSQNRSTIKRDRAVIRLSIMRSRSRDQVKNEKAGDSDRPAVSNYTPVESTPINTEKPQKSSWRDNFGEDLFPRTKDFTRKTPGELLLERHIIRDKQDTFKFADLSKENKESDALLTVDSIRRLSLTKCPSFHEICEDISSDKIDDDLNAGELRRRASLIQEQEIEIFNELQKSGSGLIQYILERNESKDDCRKSVKRKSKRSKKIRHKITATVHIDDASAAPLTVIPIPEEPSPTQVSPPKIIFSVDEIAEDHMVNTVVVLPKKKKPKIISEEPKKCEKDPIAEEVKPLEEQSRSASEKDKTEKMPQIIVKSDSVVNVTLEINKKTKPKIFDDSESKISEKKSSPEKQIDEGISLRKLSPEKITAEKILAKKVCPEKMEAEKKPSIKKLSAEKTDVDETKTVVKKLSSEKKNEDSEAKKSSPVTKTISAKDLKKPTDISSLEVKTAVDVERSKSLPPATLQDSTPAVSVSSRKSVVEGKELSVSKLEPEKKANLEKESSAENKNEAQPQKSSEKPKSVSQIKELFGKDKIVGSKDSNLTNKNEVKPKVKELSPEKKIGLKDKAAIFEVKKETTAGKFPLKSTIKETSPEKKIANISFEAKIKDQEPVKENDFLNKISVANKDGAAPSIAKPKPIVKLQRSDSGEDFWGQIGSRETLYMDKRKQKVVVSQWEKREHLLEDRDLENITDAKSIQTMKDKLGMQKIEALKEATLSSTKTDVRRSISNASALQKPEIVQKLPSILTSKSPATVKSVEPKEKLPIDQSAATKPSNKSDNIDVKATCDKKISPDRLPLKIEENLTTSTTTTNKTQNDKIDGPTPLTSIRSTSAETQPTPSSTLLPRNATAAPAAAAAPASNASDDRSAPKINVGLAAKSPETKIKQQTNKLLKDSGQKTDRTPTEDNYKDPINLSKATTPTTTSTSVATPKPSTAITPAKKGDQQQKCSALIESGRVANAAEKKDTGLNALPAGTPPQTKSPLSPSTIQTSATNSNNGGQHDNDKISTIEIGSPKENKTTRSGSENSPQQRSNEQKQLPAVAPVLVLSGGGVTAINRIEESGTKNAIIDADRDDVIANRSATALQPTKDDSRDSSDSTVSKIRTVSDLNRCLIDVDAELSDYYPSDQSSDEDVNTSECSSCQGDSNRYSRSMKKKEKHRHHNQQKKKEKDANKFDPNKKVKLDHTKKCYVKDEPAPYPLIATPRPLWKREKITYPQDSSSDSEETESDSECSTSEDECSGDDLTTTTAKNDASTSLNATSDIRMSTCSNDSGFEGGTAPTSPKKMLGTHEGDLTPSHKPIYKIYSNHYGDDLETSYTYAQFQRSGRITAPATIIPRFKKYSVDDFHFLAVLGKGSFGKVLLAELRNTDYCYAVKCLKKDVVLEDDDVECTLIERKVLAMGTQHPYLCHLFCTFQTESHLFFVMEYLNGGDLMFHIQQSGRFPEPRARFYAAEIISGLKFLHKKGIIYRDLKLDNVLLDFDGHVRIADFGMCKLKIYLDNTADSFCGTPDYMAPEVIKGDKYNQNVDWWSFGVLLYEMLIGQSPFSGCDEDELFWSICNEMPWIPKYISDQAMSILKGLLEKDANFRIGSIHSPAGDICDQAFFKEIDWNRLNRRAIDPPFKPQVKHPLDTKYFDKTFTRERVRLTPIDKEILQSMDQVPFQGFSYTNPNATLN